MPCIAALLRAQARLLDRQTCCASARVRTVEHSPIKHVCGPRLSKAHKRLHAQSHTAYTCVVARGAPLDLDALELQTPDIDNDLQSYQANDVATSFHNKEDAMNAYETGAALTDLSHWTRLHVAGPDRLTFLHNQSTFDCGGLQPGQTFNTVFTTAQGRCLHFARCIVQSTGVLVIAYPAEGRPLMQRLDKYILYNDEVSLQDVSSKCSMFSLAGPQATDILTELGAPTPAAGEVQMTSCQGSPVVIAGGSELAVPGYLIIVDEAAAAELYRSLIVKGAIPVGKDDWETARIQQGRPVEGRELMEDYNPLEAGLYQAVSLNKGCYMGQETLAKVYKQNAVKQQLWNVKFDGPVQPGTPLLSGANKAGIVTSVAQLPDGTHIGLAYVKCRAKGVQVAVEGLHLSADGSSAQVVTRPYACWQFPDGQGVQGPAPEASEDLDDRSMAAKANKEAEKAAAAAAKEERLKAMQERLAAWQASQQST